MRYRCLFYGSQKFFAVLPRYGPPPVNRMIPSFPGINAAFRYCIMKNNIPGECAVVQSNMQSFKYSIVLLLVAILMFVYGYETIAQWAYLIHISE
jgi:hypothetical protein